MQCTIIQQGRVSGLKRRTWEKKKNLLVVVSARLLIPLGPRSKAAQSDFDTQRCVLLRARVCNCVFVCVRLAFGCASVPRRLLGPRLDSKSHLTWLSGEEPVAMTRAASNSSDDKTRGAIPCLNWMAHTLSSEAGVHVDC